MDFKWQIQSIYICIYISNIQSASEDSGCGLFLYRIYEQLAISYKSMWVLDVWLLLPHLFPCRCITIFFLVHIWTVIPYSLFRNLKYNM